MLSRRQYSAGAWLRWGRSSHELGTILAALDAALDNMATAVTRALSAAGARASLAQAKEETERLYGLAAEYAQRFDGDEPAAFLAQLKPEIDGHLSRYAKQVRLDEESLCEAVERAARGEWHVWDDASRQMVWKKKPPPPGEPAEPLAEDFIVPATPPTPEAPAAPPPARRSGRRSVSDDAAVRRALELIRSGQAASARAAAELLWDELPEAEKKPGGRDTYVNRLRVKIGREVPRR